MSKKLIDELAKDIINEAWPIVKRKIFLGVAFGFVCGIVFTNIVRYFTR